MAETSKIEWCDATFNPWIGCTKVSPGCDHCYAERQNAHRKWTAGGAWGPHAARRRTSVSYWKQPHRWAQTLPNKLQRRPRVFCASLADWLDNQVPQQWRIDLALLVHATPQLDWLLLTKRIENFQRLSPWPVALPDGGQAGFPSNVWLGVTAEDQEHFDRRWKILSQIPASVRFISYEPALGIVWDISGNATANPDWVICGGESGPGARMMEPAWARDVQMQCRVRRVPFFMKQMTSKTPIPDDLLVRQFPRSAA